jgi:predicted XRE-type DNA-binding protein
MDWNSFMGFINEQMIRDQVLTSKEVTEVLDIKRARLSQMAKSGKLIPIKKNVYLLSDVLKRKEQQEELRKKYYRPSNRKE